MVAKMAKILSLQRLVWTLNKKNNSLSLFFQPGLSLVVHLLEVSLFQTLFLSVCERSSVFYGVRWVYTGCGVSIWFNFCRLAVHAGCVHCRQRKPALKISCSYYVGFSVYKLCENVEYVSDSLAKLYKECEEG